MCTGVSGGVQERKNTLLSPVYVRKKKKEGTRCSGVKK